MSSHHIVKEKQEPALIIADIAAISAEKLGQLLEWSPTTICSSEEYDAIVATGMKVDVVFGAIPYSALQENVQCISCEQEEGNFIDRAIRWLSQNGYSAATIIGSLTEIADLIHYNQSLTVSLVSKDRKTYVAKTGFVKWYPKSTIIHLEAEQKGRIRINRYQAAIPCAWAIPADGLYAFSYEKEAFLITEEI